MNVTDSRLPDLDIFTSHPDLNGMWKTFTRKLNVEYYDLKTLDEGFKCRQALAYQTRTRDDYNGC